MIVPITLDDLAVRALASATSVYNSINQTTLTPQEFFNLRVSEQLDSLVRHYKERATNDLIQRFQAASPETQAAVLTQLTQELPAQPASPATVDAK